MAASFKRSGLHRLGCPMCATYGYYTVAMLEDAGLPTCWRKKCGETLVPEKLELAMLLECEDAPVMLAYRAKCSSVAHGQAWTGRDAAGFDRPEQRAYESISREQRKASRERRLAALLPVPEPMAF